MTMKSKCEIEHIVKNTTIMALSKADGKKYVPVAVSNHHLHLSEKDAYALFGQGYQFKIKTPLSQPGQYACEEVVTVVGKKGRIEKMRVLGPFRKETQVEITVSDSYALGVPPVVRMSGDLEGTPGCQIIGPVGSVDIPKGVIVSKRHLHLSQTQADFYGFKNNDTADLIVTSSRPGVIGEVVVRCGEGHELEIHIDTDEANAFMIKNGTVMEIR